LTGSVAFQPGKAGERVNDPAFEKSPFRDCRPRGDDRLWGTWYLRVNATGQILELDVMIVRAETWAGRPEAQNSEWDPMDFDDLIVAVKAQC
jgi:hypothetical protein